MNDKKGKVWFHPIHGDGLLSVAWVPGPYGDAVFPEDGSGVGFFSRNGELLCAEFFNVSAKSDHQVLRFSNRFKNIVEVRVKNKKVDVKLFSKEHPYKKTA